MQRGYRLVALALVLALALLSGCAPAQPAATPQPTPEPTATPEPTPEAPEITYKQVGVTVDPSVTYQTFLGLGGNYAQVQYTGTALDSIGQYLLDDYGPEYIRICMPLHLWEPVNDNDDPYTTDPAAFVTDGEMASLFYMLRLMHDKYGIEHILASIWDIPPWMNANGEGTKGAIDPEMYDEFAESVVAFLAYVKENCGVEIEYIAVNEPDILEFIHVTAEESVTLIREVGPRMKEAGLNTLFLVGDVSKPSAAIMYFKAVLENEDIYPYLGALSYHSWNAGLCSDNELKGLRKYAQESDRALLCAEFGNDPQLYKTPEEFPKWSTAWGLASTFSRLLRFSGTQIFYYWEFENDYPLLSPELEPYPSYYVLRQVTDNLLPGYKIMESNSANEVKLMTLAAGDGGDGFMLQLISRYNDPVEVKLAGLPDMPLRIITTGEDAYLVEGGVLEQGADRMVVLPPKSILTLTSIMPEE